MVNNFNIIKFLIINKIYTISILLQNELVELCPECDYNSASRDFSSAFSALRTNLKAEVDVPCSVESI